MGNKTQYCCLILLVLFYCVSFSLGIVLLGQKNNTQKESLVIIVIIIFSYSHKQFGGVCVINSQLTHL